jgi:2-desacetyl-2-hydroxyethyl bacteriochlorophyllide A dehydrogenase
LISPGTERAFFLGLENTSQKYPQYPGYSNAGEVAALGPGVDGLRVGDRVASIGKHAGYTIVQSDRVFRVPNELHLEHATFWNLSTVSLQGIRKARVELGESVLVLGQGLVGNLVLQLARLSGGTPTIAVDSSESRRKLALACGADVAVAPENTTTELAKISDSGAAVVIESTGAAEPVNTAFQLAAWHGRVVLLASTRGLTEKVNFYKDVHCKALTIIGAHNNSRPKQESSPGYWTVRDDAHTVLRLLASGRLNVAPLISHRVKSENAMEAYQLLGSWNDTLVGAVLQWC